jgi:hypothetical protein
VLLSTISGVAPLVIALRGYAFARRRVWRDRSHTDRSMLEARMRINGVVDDLVVVRSSEIANCSESGGCLFGRTRMVSSSSFSTRTDVVRSRFTKSWWICAARFSRAESRSGIQRSAHPDQRPARPDSFGRLAHVALMPCEGEGMPFAIGFVIPVT